MGKGEWKGRQKGTAEYRELDREQKRKSRAVRKTAAYTPSADEWIWSWENQHPGEAAEVREYVRNIQRKVREELKWPPSTFETLGWTREQYAEAFPLGNTPEAEAVDHVARTYFGFTQPDKAIWVRRVSDPDGVVVSGSYFPDVLGSDIVAATHRAGLEKSQTFSTLYRELLQILDQQYGHERTEHSIAIRAELDHKYVLPDLAAF